MSRNIEQSECTCRDEVNMFKNKVHIMDVLIKLVADH